MKALAVALLLLAGPALADGRDPRWTAEGRKRIVTLTRALESHPLDDKDKSQRSEVLGWWVSVPNLRLAWCSELLLEGKNEKTRAIVVTQGMFGAGARLIEKGTASALELATAGLESALLAYRNAVKADASYRDAFYDSLADAQKARGYVTEKLQRCAASAAR